MHIEPIAEIYTPYKTKFAIPRQPGLVPAAKGEIRFHEKYRDINMLRGLEQFSHIWLIFCFHHTEGKGWKPLVRPPRLGGNKQVGVLASRSTFRPNPIGMSLVKLESIQFHSQQPSLIVSGMDLVDQTPIIDIKPYLPYSDIQPDAVGGYAVTEPELMQVVIPEPLQLQLTEIEKQYNDFTLLVKQVLAQDPRPAYRKGKPDNKIYGVTLYGYDIRFSYPNLNQISLTEIVKLTPVSD